MKKFTVLTIVLLASIAASAGPVTVVFGGFHASGPQGWAAGFPYFATINGGPQVDVMCDDWFHGGYVGQTWYANVTDLGTGNLANVRFNGLPNYPTLYKEVGWLLLQTRVTPLQSDWTDINFAVWHIFDSTAPLQGNAGYWYGQAQIEASLGFPNVNFHDVWIYTPAYPYQHDPDPNGPQELLRPVPEPMTLTLLAGGLLGIWGRKKLL